MVRISGCDWDRDNVEHLAKHQVEPDEVEEVFALSPHIRRTREMRYLAYGTTANGRYLTVVFRHKGRGIVRVITARNMTQREKKLYKERRR